MASLRQPCKPAALPPAQIAWPYVNQILILVAAAVPLTAILLLVRVPIVLPSPSLVSIASAAGIALLSLWMAKTFVANAEHIAESLKITLLYRR